MVRSEPEVERVVGAVELRRVVLTTELSKNVRRGAVTIVNLKKVKIAVCAALQVEVGKGNPENLKRTCSFNSTFHTNRRFRFDVLPTRSRNAVTDLVRVSADDPSTAGLVIIVVMTRVIGKAEGPSKPSQGAATLCRQSRGELSMREDCCFSLAPSGGSHKALLSHMIAQH